MPGPAKLLNREKKNRHEARELSGNKKRCDGRFGVNPGLEKGNQRRLAVFAAHSKPKAEEEANVLKVPEIRRKEGDSVTEATSFRYQSKKHGKEVAGSSKKKGTQKSPPRPFCARGARPQKRKPRGKGVWG